MKQRLILFDIDGTILHLQYGISRNIFSSVIENIFKITVPDTALPSFAGRTDLSILYDIADNVGIEHNAFTEKLPVIWNNIHKEFQEICNSDNMELLPYAKELIDSINANSYSKLALVTGNSKENAYLKLSSFDLDKHFPIGAFGSDHKNRNQLPKIAIDRANEYYKSDIFSSKNSIIIGDSPLDIVCAKSNNMPVIAVATGGVSVEELSHHDPDMIVENFSEINHIINSIERLTSQ
jgi:phosphoglycolate phosphatase-like HAD superfamily hydrolase